MSPALAAQLEAAVLSALPSARRRPSEMQAS